MLGGSNISQCGLSVLYWQRPGLTLDRGGVYKAESLPLVVIRSRVELYNYILVDLAKSEIELYTSLGLPLGWGLD